MEIGEILGKIFGRTQRAEKPLSPTNSGSKVDEFAVFNLIQQRKYELSHNLLEIGPNK